MLLQEKVNEELKQALAEKNRDNVLINRLKMIKSELQRKGTTNLPDSVAFEVLKQMKNSAIECSNIEEANFYAAYLPELMSDDEIKIAVDSIIADYAIALDMKSFGMIMGKFNALYKGKADNIIVSNIVKQILS
jgi:uncharacterized protein YqeY